MSLRVAILISGGGSNMVRLVESMGDGDHPARPVLVLSDTPEAGGLNLAANMGVPVAVAERQSFDRKSDFEAALAQQIDAARADLICLAGFMRVLSADFVSRYQGRILNIHPSLLPAYKGLNTHARALADGVSEHGCTVHLVTAALDDGPILGQARVTVRPDDTADRLAARVLAREHLLYPAVLARVAADDWSRHDLC